MVDKYKWLIVFQFLVCGEAWSQVDFKDYPVRSVGPSVMSGRVVDVEVNPENTAHFLVAYASGGVFETKNNGQTFVPIFDDAPTTCVGDIAVDWALTQGRSIWVGTGENNSSRSSYAGLGLYHSANGGKTWAFKGLEDSHHVGRIVLHPTDSNRVTVAVMGHLYSKNAERGVFLTTDGGKNWQKTLFVNDSTGCIDLVRNPSNPNELFAAAWERQRSAWHFKGAGSGSGLYKSSDNGLSWQLVSLKGSGFPVGKGVGRIGLDMHPDGSLFAVLDNNNPKPKEPESATALNAENLRTMSKQAFMAIENKRLNKFLKKHHLREKYNAESIKKEVDAGRVKLSDLANYLGDANAALFDVDFIGAEVYKSVNGGQLWQKTHKEPLDDVFFTYGYYFGQIRVSPHNAQILYILAVPLLCSKDGGQTWESLEADNLHADHHALWINPKKAGHLINGNDGGLNISYDDGKNWSLCNSPDVGQIYAIAVDQNDPYNVYAGFQDNGVWVGPSTYEHSTEWHKEGHYPYKHIMGGDGMQIQVDPENADVVYTGYQFGNYSRLNLNTKEEKNITPRHQVGEFPYQFNWQTPILLSPFAPNILYMGSSFLHRSTDKGKTWKKISPNLTTTTQKGNVPYGTVTAIHESGLQLGLLYVGTDDGHLWTTETAGAKWLNITPIKNNTHWVSRVQASAHDSSTVYVCLNGYRTDFFEPLVYGSKNKGKTWVKLGRNLPQFAVNVLREDPVKPHILYLGTDGGLFVSLDTGATFNRFGTLPNVPVHDLVIHPSKPHLLVGTHGRSLYQLNLKNIRNIKPTNSDLEVSPVSDVEFSEDWGNSWSKWFKPTEPNATLSLYAPQKLVGTTIKVTLVHSESKTKLSKHEFKIKKIGFSEFEIPLAIDKTMAESSVLEKIYQTPPTEAKNKKTYPLKDRYLLVIDAPNTSIEKAFEIK